MAKNPITYLLIFDSTLNHYFVESVQDRRRRPAGETVNLSIKDQGRLADMNRKATRLNEQIEIKAFQL
jgi:hypothetical protein